MNLKEYLQKNNITLIRVAKELGMSYPYLFQIANGYRSPSDKIASKISDYTKGEVTPDELMWKPVKRRCPCCGRPAYRLCSPRVPEMWFADFDAWERKYIESGMEAKHTLAMEQYIQDKIKELGC